MTEIRELLDREAIKETKARYFRYIDTKDWDGLRTVFTDDAMIAPSKVKAFEGVSPLGDANGPDDFVQTVATLLGPRMSVHHGHMPEITFTGPDTASVIWSMTDIVEDPRVSSGQRGIVGYGHYEEEYRRVETGWKIASLRLTRLRIDPIIAPEGPARGDEGRSPTDG